MAELNRFLQLVSGYKVLSRVDSPINGKIEVIRQFGETSVIVGGLTQSGEPIKSVWGKTVKKISRNFKGKILILGLGSGTLAHLIYKRCPKSDLIGVELDPLMVDLGKEHLKLEEIGNLGVHLADAFSFAVSQAKSQIKYDLIFVDVYLGGEIPIKMDSEEFYKTLIKITSPQGKIYINRLFYTEETRNGAKATIEKLEKIGFKINLSRIFTNLILEITPPRLD